MLLLLLSFLVGGRPLKGDAHFNRTALDYACADANVFWNHIRHD